MNFAVKPPQEEQFRVSFQVEYSDRNQRHQVFEYANVVNVLRPVRNYEPILNPYAPGTPLRKNSRLFSAEPISFSSLLKKPVVWPNRAC